MALAAAASISANGGLSAWTARRVICAAALRARAQRPAGGELWGRTFGCGVGRERSQGAHRCLQSLSVVVPLRRVLDARCSCACREGRAYL